MIRILLGLFINDVPERNSMLHRKASGMGFRFEELLNGEDVMLFLQESSLPEFVRSINSFFGKPLLFFLPHFWRISAVFHGGPGRKFLKLIICNINTLILSVLTEGMVLQKTRRRNRSSSVCDCQGDGSHLNLMMTSCQVVEAFLGNLV